MQTHYCQLMWISRDHNKYASFLNRSSLSLGLHYQKTNGLMRRMQGYNPENSILFTVSAGVCILHLLDGFLSFFTLCFFWEMMCCGTKNIGVCVCFIEVIIMLNTTMWSLVVVASSSPCGVFFLVALKFFYLLFSCETSNTPKNCPVIV